jgi:hypothetical protein
MTKRKFFKKPIELVAATVLVVTTLSAALIVHTISANVYYNLNLLKLQVAADLAVRAGVEYLPTDPRIALQVATAYAERNGVAFNEIMLVGVDRYRRTLRIRLSRKIPIYISLLAIRLPHRDIVVTSFAQRQTNRAEAPLRITEAAYDQFFTSFRY